MSARYLIGVDLGTSNTAMAWLDSTQADARPAVFAIPQVVASGEVAPRELLPSFIYLPAAGEAPAGSLDLPWAAGRDYAVGTHARQLAGQVANRVVASAKSWLCHAGVDRQGAILPWGRNQPERMISPVLAAQRLLEHLRDAWNHQMAGSNPGARFEVQDIMLTVPASFDPAARDLTVAAATAAGLTSVHLLEEPQAAFYAWLHSQGEGWRAQLRAGETVLVCDIGGGTTDFSLIGARDDAGNLVLERLAVGEHILLGGDNLDLALAHGVATRLQRERNLRLDAWQLSALTHACRAAKERLAEDRDSASQRLTVLGRGSSVIGGTITTELTRAELERLLGEGFLPDCPADARPAERRLGLRGVGLQYAADAAITRHLASFLARHGQAGPARPDAVLFNGGVTKSPLLRERLLALLSTWSGRPVRELHAPHPDVAVALGACRYGQVRRGQAVRIKAGSAHAYFVGVEPAVPAVPGFTPPLEALCVVPFGMEEGSEQAIPAEGLGLVVGEATEFRFFASTGRRQDAAGALLPDAGDPELTELPPLRAECPADDRTPPGTVLPVTLRSVLTDIGTLELWCHEAHGQRRWPLRYELRTRPDPA